MKRLLLPIILICFTILCLVFVHVDNMNKLGKEIGKVDQSNTEIVS